MTRMARLPEARVVAMPSRWSPDLLKEHYDEVHRQRDVATVQLRECNLEAIRSADRVAEARIAAQSLRVDQLERSTAASLDRLTRLVYAGVGVALAVEFLIPLLRR